MIDKQIKERACIFFRGRELTTRLENYNDDNHIRYPTSPAFGSLFTGLLVVHRGIDETSEENARKSRR
jgi:hypothetical protein